MQPTSTPDPTYPQYADLIAEARRRTTTIIDPGVLATVDSVATARGPRWCQAVLGRYFWGLRWLTYTEMHLLLLADRACVDPPEPAWILAEEQASRDRGAEPARARERYRERDHAEWLAIAERVTVALAVYANTQSRVRRGFPHHLGHAVPEVDVYSGDGRIRTHRAGRALCETETRGKPLRLIFQPEPAGTPVTCERCRLWAPRVRATP